jgi:thymidylate synthase
MNIYKTNSEAYLGTLRDILESPDVKSAPRGQPVREKLDYSFRVMEPDSTPIVTKDSERNATIASYTAKEVELYNGCSNLASDFGKASKFWLSLANPDGTVNSAYGYLIWENKSHGSHFECQDDGYGGDEAVMRTPWEWAKQSLIADKDTRQAIMRFSLPSHQWVGNKDQTCTMHANWLIRNDQIHLSVVMRSNDMMLGLVYDLPWFCSLMDKMIEELRPTYPNLTKGFYTHTVHSMHIYERDIEKIHKMLGN